uniref:Uncharacterized protein n=1 Tax=Glossina brevipalpis TaxID=37001 RepID=A0A1A9W528_9MUSC
MSVQFLKSKNQHDGLYQHYINLGVHLADSYYLQNQSKDVQIQTALCLAELLRVCAPAFPFKEKDQIKAVYLFFIKKLYGLKNPKDVFFQDYIYLLERLACVKFFNACSAGQDSKKICRQFFNMMFSVINESHSVEVKNFMINILSPLIRKPGNFTIELLELFLSKILEPKKSQNESSYQLAKELIFKTKLALGPILIKFFDRYFVTNCLGNDNEIFHEKTYNIIRELNIIEPTILLTFISQMGYKLELGTKSEHERLAVITLLMRIFSDENSNLCKEFPDLLSKLMKRFDDNAVSIRVKCIQFSVHYLINQPNLRQDIIKCLYIRNHDTETTVRYEVVMAIIETAKRNLNIIYEFEELLIIIKDRALDKISKIRREALIGLSIIYQKTLENFNDLPIKIEYDLNMITNRVMHSYFLPTLTDRLIVERLLINYFIPYQLNSKERMKRLYRFLATLDFDACLAFMKSQLNQMNTRQIVKDWIILHNTKEITMEIENELNVKQSIICKMLPETMNESDFLKKFSINLRNDPIILSYMETILKDDVTCKECINAILLILKKLDAPCKKSLYYEGVKLLLEILTPVMVDKESINALVGLCDDYMKGENSVKEVGISKKEAGICGLKILDCLSEIFPAYFFTDETLRHMIALLSYEEDYIAPLILKTFTRLGRYKALAEIKPDIMCELAVICQDYTLNGTVEEAKLAVRCIYENSQSLSYQERLLDISATPQIHPIFYDIVKSLHNSMNPNYNNQCTKIVTLGHIAYQMPQAFSVSLKKLIGQYIVKKVLVNYVSPVRACNLSNSKWYEVDELPPDTVCRLEALKTMARWLLGASSTKLAIPKVFRVLFLYIDTNGFLSEQYRLVSAEKSWLRLRAACAILKICEQKVIADECTAKQFLDLSELMYDPEPKVREMFTFKLYKGLAKDFPNKCLPVDFMGYYILSGYETDENLADQAREYFKANVNKRREYFKMLSTRNTNNLNDPQSLQYLPDFMLTFAIPILVHHPSFTNYQDHDQLKQVEKALHFILEPLISEPDDFLFTFYQCLIEMMKNHYLKNENGGNESDLNNSKMWTICDIANCIIRSKMSSCKMWPNEKLLSLIQLPSKYFKPRPYRKQKLPKVILSLLMPTLLVKTIFITVEIKENVNNERRSGVKRSRSKNRNQIISPEIVNNENEDGQDNQLALPSGRKRKFI